MNHDFLQKNFPALLNSHANSWANTWVVSLVSASFDGTKLIAVTQLLATVFADFELIYQHTLVSPSDWAQNATLPQHSQTSPATTLQWVISPVATHNNPLSQRELIEKIRKPLSQLNQNNPQPIDINIMPLATLCRPHRLALFDMDSTLIEQEVIVELAKKAGIGEQVNEITESAMRGEIDFSESFTRRVGLLKGLPKSVLNEIIRDNISFSLGAKRLITALKNNGYHVVLVSGGFDFFAEFVKNELGIDEVYANPLDFIDDELTGQVTAPIVDGKRKAEILQEVAKRLNIDLSETVAVGDGANDLPMLGLADIGIAYRAKPIVQEQADYAVNVAGLDGVMALLGLA